MLPSFEGVWVNNQRTKPRIQILEIRHRDRPDGDPLAWLLVERQETYHYDDRDNTIYKASISISSDQGADTRLIQDYLGHRNIQHTVCYTATNSARFERLWR